MYGQETPSLKGIVLSEKGEALSGVSVTAIHVIHQTISGTLSDTNGLFQFAGLKSGDLYNLSFRYTGFEPNEIKAFKILPGKQNTLLIRLKQVTGALNEVVVIGYGTKRKNEITGAVNQIEAKEFANRPITQTSQLFYGLIPGVLANANTGEAGNDQTTIRIRGIGTLNDAGALVLVDGIEAPLDNIQPSDIASVTVLKDAAAASIYGSRAANGVILVTTKRGAFNSKVAMEYNAYTGSSAPTVLPKMVTNNTTYLQLYREAAANSNIISSISDADIDRYGNRPSTDWFKVLLNQHAGLQSHVLSLRSGSDNLACFVSLGYLNQESILKGGQGLERYNTRFNLDAKVNNRLHSGASLAYSYARANLASKGEPEYTAGSTDVNSLVGKGSLAFEAALTQHPIVPIYDSMGRYATLEQKLGIQRNRNNGQGILDNEKLQQQDNKLLGNLYAEYALLPGITIRGVLGLNYQQTGYTDTRRQYSNYDAVTGRQVSVIVPGSQLIDVQSTSQNVTTVLQASYEKKTGHHTWKALLGYNQESANLKTNTEAQLNFANTSLVTLGNGAITTAASATQGQWALRSLFGRAGYTYAEKYLLEANFRRDGSSRFGSSHRYGNFPSFSAGWIVSREPFWKSSNIPFLKLRASWGKLGNQNTALYPFASQISLANGYALNNTYTSGAALLVQGNPGLKWETSTTTNLGIDIRLFQSAWTLEADYFLRNTTDILTPINHPLTSGIILPTIVNAASIQNKGWEINTSYAFHLAALTLALSGNLTYVSNKVTAINPSLSSDADKVELNAASSTWLIRGQPVNAIYGYQAMGIFQSQSDINKAPDHRLFGNPQPGDFRFRDTDNDGVITSKDRVVIGNRQPKWIYGFTLKTSYRGMDLNILFQGVGRFNMYQSRQTGPFPFAGIRQYWENRWTPEHPSTTMPRLWVDRSGYNGTTIENLPSSFWVQNLAYLRLKNIQVGYSLPPAVAKKIGVQNIRCYLNAQNLFTFTRYKDFDPERLTTQQFVTNSLPQLKIFTIGIHLLF